MIFVTVGTHNQGFDRLVQAADELAATTDEKILIQCGSSTYEPRFAEYFQWTSGQKMKQFTCEARIVITHAAAGAIILAFQHGKPLIVVPRSKRFNEHGDDHQQELANALAAQERTVIVQEPSVAALYQAVEQVKQQQYKENDGKRLILALQKQLAVWN